MTISGSSSLFEDTAATSKIIMMGAFNSDTEHHASLRVKSPAAKGSRRMVQRDAKGRSCYPRPLVLVRAARRMRARARGNWTLSPKPEQGPRIVPKCLPSKRDLYLCTFGQDWADGMGEICREDTSLSVVYEVTQRAYIPKLDWHHLYATGIQCYSLKAELSKHRKHEQSTSTPKTLETIPA